MLIWIVFDNGLHIVAVTIDAGIEKRISIPANATDAVVSAVAKDDNAISFTSPIIL